MVNEIKIRRLKGIPKESTGVCSNRIRQFTVFFADESAELEDLEL